MRIAITGGAGYCGSVLVPHLLSKGHQIRVLDTFWFDDHIPDHPSLLKIKGDIRSVDLLQAAFADQDAVIHMACISNDPSFDMNPRLGREINLDCFVNICREVNAAKVRRFIYASSSSVYGVSDLGEVTEDSPKEPLTDYSKFKLTCENQLAEYAMSGTWTVVRPATLCGYSPRMRLDLVVNIFTIQALVNRKITLFGTDQKRPNIDVFDMARAYEFLLNEDEAKIHRQVFNVGFENLTLLQIAELVREVVGKDVDIVVEPTRDPRSYHVNSDKFKSLGFQTSGTIKDAIKSLVMAHDIHGMLDDPMNNPMYYNIKRMKELNL